MKRLMLFVSLVMALTAVDANASKHRFFFLIGQPQVNIEFDYSQTKFDENVPTDNLANFRDLWEVAFIRELNNKLEDAPFILVPEAESDYTFVITPTKATKYGFRRALVTVFDADGRAIKMVELKTSPNYHIKLLDRYVDSMEDMGRHLGKMIDKGF